MDRYSRASSSCGSAFKWRSQSAINTFTSCRFCWKELSTGEVPARCMFLRSISCSFRTLAVCAKAICEAGSATVPMRPGRFRQRRQTFLFYYKFHIFTLHDSSLRGSWRWIPWPSGFSQIVAARFPDARREAAHTPLIGPHCSSIIMRRLSFCRVAYFPCLLADLFLEQVPQTRTRLMQLRLRISYRASHNFRDLVVLVPPDGMQYEYGPVARGQLLNRTFQIDPVDGATQAQIRRADVLPGAARFIVGIRCFFERGHRERLLAQPHQHHIDCHPVQPGREGRLSAEGPNLAEELQKGFLHQVFRVGRVIHHSQAQSVDASAMQVI